MMFDSNYDTCLAGVGDGAQVGVANGKNIISKHDSKFKKIGVSKRIATTLDSSFVFGAKSGSRASQVAPKIKPMSGKNQSKN